MQHKLIVETFQNKVVSMTEKQVELLVSLECRYTIKIDWIKLSSQFTSVISASSKINAILQAVKDGKVKARQIKMDFYKHLDEVKDIINTDMMF